MLLLQPGLLEHAVERPSRQFIARLSRDRYASWFRGMLELAMATTACHAVQTVYAQQFQYLANLHYTNDTKRR